MKNILNPILSICAVLIFGSHLISCQSGTSVPEDVLAMNGFENTASFDVTFGIRKDQYTRQELESGITQLFHCQEPFLLKLEDGGLKLTMTLYDTDGNPAGEIKRNNLVSGEDKFDVNFDDTAIEFVNEYGIVAMRIEVEAPNKIIISGAVKCDPEVIISSPEITRQLPANNPENEAFLQRQYGQGWMDFYLQEGARISPLFLYEGNDYIGKRRSGGSDAEIPEIQRNTNN